MCVVVVLVITLTECLLCLLPGPSHPTGEDPGAQGLTVLPLTGLCSSLHFHRELTHEKQGVLIIKLKSTPATFL